VESTLWVPFMLRKAAQLLREVPMDAVLVSCPPFHPAMAGVLLKKRFGIALVVDYRDAWGLNPYRQRLHGLRRCILEGDKLLEKCLLRNSNFLLVSHQEMKERYLRHFSFLRDRVEVIYNGFDPDKIGDSKSTLFPEFTILHLGNFYARQKTRDPQLFLSALQGLISEKKIPSGRFRVLFVGERYAEIEKMIADHGLSAYVSCVDRVPHEVAVDYLNRSHVLLLIETLDVMTTKVYEYLATGKPMLCLIREGGELEGLIRSFSTHASILGNDPARIKEALGSCFEVYQTGGYRPVVNEEFRNRFSRMEQTRRLADLLHRIESQEISSLRPEVRG
jgi:glycosyltransferase involved in cell wall biosynthesis